MRRYAMVAEYALKFVPMKSLSLQGRKLIFSDAIIAWNVALVH
jgi:hypothetical protein